MVTTVTDNSPQAINTSLFSLEKDTDGKVLLLNNKIKEANDAIAAINKILDGINKDAGVVSVNGKQGIVTLDASDIEGFAEVATSGSYNDLSNKPTIPAAQVNSDWNATSGVARILNKPSLATVATSGSYNDLSNKPTIPTKTSELTNDSGFATTTEVSSTVSSFVPTILGIQDSNDPDNFPTDGVRVYKVRQYNIGWVSNDGFILNIPWNDNYGFQIAMDDESNFMAVRHKNGGVWSGWQQVSLT